MTYTQCHQHTHTHTTHTHNTHTQVYEYALFPAYRRVEVASNASAQLNVWQEEVRAW